MQNAQMAAAMNTMNANAGGPVDGTPMMGQRPLPNPNGTANDPPNQLNTYIYDYFVRNGYHKAAKSMIESEVPLNLKGKPSPSSRNVNGINAPDGEGGDRLPEPALPATQAVDNSFLMDWWCQFWDVFSAQRNKGGGTAKAIQYSQATRMIQKQENQVRKNQMETAMNASMNPHMNMNMNMMNMNLNEQRQQYMLRMQQQNGGIDLKRAVLNRNPYVQDPFLEPLTRDVGTHAAHSNGVGPMGNPNMNKQAMMQSAQMSRDGSNMDINGQRGQSPNSNDNAPSPNKRARVEGNPDPNFWANAARNRGMPQHLAPLAGQANHMWLAGAMNAASMAGNQFGDFAQGQNVQQKPIEVYAQNLVHQHRIALNNHVMPQAMNPGVQGSPMNPQGLEDQNNMFNGNGARPGMSNAPQNGNALQDYQMQLMLLEQQNKKRLLMARQEQDNLPHPVAGGPGFGPAMSPQGNRPGPSPNPADQMKRGTPKLGQQGLPGSPMPDAAMQQQRSSPAPGMGFDVGQVQPGMPPQFPNFGQMGQSPMMRPPSSHPGAFPGQQLTQQQMEMMRQGGMPNGPWRGGPGPQGMMPGQAQQMGAAMANAQQRNPMPPPPAPAGGDQPRTQEPSPSQPTQAPPTPSQTAKANPKKKPTKDNKKPTKAKGATTGATPAASAEDPPPTPTPSTPITPMHKSSFAQNGQQPNQQPAQAQANVPPSQPQMENPNNPPFGSLQEDTNTFTFDLDSFNPAGDPLNDFDFDSFMHNVGEDDPGLLTENFGFDDAVQASGEM